MIAGQLGYPLRFFEQGAEFQLEHNRFEGFKVRFKRSLPVLLPKEHGITETWSNNPLVTLLDHFRRWTIDIGDGDEVIHQAVLIVDQMKILLVFFHAQNQALRGEPAGTPLRNWLQWEPAIQPAR